MIDAPLTLVSAFILGLFGTVHCIAMCGAITGAFCMGLPQTSSGWSNFKYILGFNLGRITTYTFAGFILGLLGQQIYIFSDSGHNFLFFLSHIMLMAAGLYLTGLAPVLLIIEKPGAFLWHSIEPVTRKLLPINNTLKSYAYGIGWGLLPCGLLYFTLLWSASAGSAIDGAIRMFTFGLGTLPGLLATGLIASKVPGFLKNKNTRRIAGFIIITLSVVSLLLTSTSHHHQ